MAHSTHFQELGMAPTLSLAEVKRAYFKRLQKHPPHADPDGFRRLRAAYEALLAPRGLASAFVDAPFDAASEHAAWRQRWEGPMRQAADRVRRQGEGFLAVRRFVETVSHLTLAEATGLFASASQGPPDPEAPEPSAKQVAATPEASKGAS
ncbi:MAG TPA: J domain-containing protein [Anaeromyxobacteraceae bacterium]|nr:J domain-containing protein [Anaeromyxobacteraceae bacterium]